MFPWTVPALSSGGMSQMLGCASRGLGTWPEAGPLGTEFWTSGAGGESNRSRDWGRGRRLRQNIMGWCGKPAHSGLCLQQLWGLTAGDTGTDRTRRLTGWGDGCSCS